MLFSDRLCPRWWPAARNRSRASRHWCSASAWWPWTAERLGHVMTAIQDDPHEAGRSTMKAAKDYDAHDAYEAQRIRQLESEIDNPQGYQYHALPDWLKT